MGNELHLTQSLPIDAEPDDFAFLIGNDEHPLILSVNKHDCTMKILPVPNALRLKSYMNCCAIEPELPNCK